jgi:hypothetical protein
VALNCGATFAETQHESSFDLFRGATSAAPAEPCDFAITETFLFPGDPTRQYDRRIAVRGMRDVVLTETIDPYPYSAVETGYVEEVHYDILPSQGYGPHGTWNWRRNFYVKARNGQIYGAITIDLDSGKMWFGISGYINPSASRNLEPDPEKLITDPAEIQRLDEQTRMH